MVNKRPAISVVMPIYNTAPYLDAAIESVVNQTYTDFELILINDGSTDDSLSIMEKWRVADTRVKVFSQANKGLSASRNAGISCAAGKYLYFLDSDDLIQPEALARCYDCCESDELDFIFFDATVFADDLHDKDLLEKFSYQRKSFPASIVYSGREAFEQLLNYQEYFSSACLVFINRQFLFSVALRFEPNILHEDELFTPLLFLNAERTAYLPAPLFLRRVREDSIMTTAYSMNNMKSYFTVASKLLHAVKGRQDWRSLMNRQVSSMLNAALWKAHRLSICQRLHIFITCLCHWRKFVGGKTLLILLFKKYRKRL